MHVNTVCKNWLKLTLEIITSQLTSVNSLGKTLAIKLTKNNSIQDYKYFFYGLPSDYGLVGVHDRRIWLTLDDLSAAHELRTVFSPKISLAVFDLTNFQNYSENLVDNTVCLSWSVPVLEYQIHNIIKRIVNPSFSNTFISSGETKLVNAVPFFNFLSELTQQELQKQMMFFYYLTSMLVKHIDRTARDLPDTDLDIKFDQKIKTIFATELTLTDIESGLIYAANQVLGEDNLTARSRARAFYILRLFDKIYG